MALSCLVLDVALPDLNGLDLQKLVADRIDMPIIFITGYGDVPTTIRAMKAPRSRTPSGEAGRHSVRRRRSG
ncbi:MAG: DNA-binding response regulator, partial [Candidatus Rokuibacteriota bacterium]